MKLKNYILVGFIALLGLSSCGKFEKFRKNASLPVKYKAAVDYYKKKDFEKPITPNLKKIVSYIKEKQELKKKIYFNAT